MTIRAHLDDQFARQFGGLPQIEKPIASGLVVEEVYMGQLLLGNSDFEINNPHAVGVLPYDPHYQHEAEHGICAQGDCDE